LCKVSCLKTCAIFLCSPKTFFKEIFFNVLYNFFLSAFRLINNFNKLLSKAKRWKNKTNYSFLFFYWKICLYSCICVSLSWWIASRLLTCYIHLRTRLLGYLAKFLKYSQCSHKVLNIKSSIYDIYFTIQEIIPWF